MEEDYELTVCECCWKESDEVLFDGVNYVCIDCYERNEVNDYKGDYNVKDN